MAKKEYTYEDIIKHLSTRSFYPVYYLMGEEPYFIDQIAEYLAVNVLTDAEKEFNQTILYGADVTVPAIINMAKQYPMMSDYQVIIVKEAQVLRGIDELSYYLQKPLSSTILVFCHKHGGLDRRKKITAEIEKCGLLFESKKIKEHQLPAFIAAYLKKKGVAIDSKPAEMLSEFVGNDLSRLSGEMDKLVISLAQGENRITPELIERNIGVSKDYNNFELKNALIEKDVIKANTIIRYFINNPRHNPLQMTLSLLFNFYSNLMLAYYAPDKSEQGVAAMLGLRSPWQAREYISAMRRYNGIKVMEIIGEIRYCDARSKGVGNSSVDGGELLRELVFKILH